mmetsp:Transcript_8959/g.24894  ORF Transcript_8959/g.24894 Transcript_8959/m.24894 type:complete len:335 (-) Transcript_8959:8-1012(-)
MWGTCDSPAPYRTTVESRSTQDVHLGPFLPVTASSLPGKPLTPVPRISTTSGAKERRMGSGTFQRVAAFLKPLRAMSSGSHCVCQARRATASCARRKASSSCGSLSQFAFAAQRNDLRGSVQYPRGTRMPALPTHHKRCASSSAPRLSSNMSSTYARVCMRSCALCCSRSWSSSATRASEQRPSRARIKGSPLTTSIVGTAASTLATSAPALTGLEALAATVEAGRTIRGAGAGPSHRLRSAPPPLPPWEPPPPHAANAQASGAPNSPGAPASRGWLWSARGRCTGGSGTVAALITHAPRTATTAAWLCRAQLAARTAWREHEDNSMVRLACGP